MTILEGDKHKTGGKDFASVFNKQSKYDYFSMMNKESKKTPISKPNKDEKTILHTGEESSQRNGYIPLPLIQNKVQNNDSLKLNYNIKTSLKGVLDALDMYPDYDENEGLNLNNVDIFKKRKNYLDIKSKEKDRISNSQEEINKFNFNIIRNNQWGQQSNVSKTGDAVRIPIKPTKKDLERELGISNLI